MVNNRLTIIRYHSVHCSVYVHCLLQLFRLLYYGVRLSGSLAASSKQKTRRISEHRLNFIVSQAWKVLRVDERVPSAIQSHLTVHLCTPYSHMSQNTCVHLTFMFHCTPSYTHSHISQYTCVHSIVPSHNTHE